MRHAGLLSRARHIVAVVVAPGTPGQFFGGRFFGRSFFGKRFFG